MTTPNLRAARDALAEKLFIQAIMAPGPETIMALDDDGRNHLCNLVAATTLAVANSFVNRAWNTPVSD
jgi:hypothetical protein